MATSIKYINTDFVKVRASKRSSKTAFYLYFGDPVIIETIAGNWTKITAPNRITNKGNKRTGFVKSNNIPVRDTGILKMSMVDVQQGDGIIMETPGGKIIFIDGGDNKLFARHAAARFRYYQSTKDKPLPVEAIIITHGDADHFDGLNDIRRSQTLTGSRRYKRLFIHPKKILHNGIIKRPTKIRNADRLGATTLSTDNQTYLTELHEDIRIVDRDEFNRPFKSWLVSLREWAENKPTEEIKMERVDNTKNPTTVFDFFEEEGLQVDVYGPILETFTATDGNQKQGLRFLPTPPKTDLLHEAAATESRSRSASHTINGHSIAFRLTYGNVRLLFTGDMNKDAMDLMETVIDPASLEAEVLKTPHHGSADFDFSFLDNVKPVVSLISSGDENPAKDHIHPRATLVNALGKVSRLEKTGILFSTELAAFFSYQKQSYTRETLADFFKNHTKANFSRAELTSLFSEKEQTTTPRPTSFEGFERTRFGLVELRTDGNRVLVFTHSGRDNVFESYAFTVTIDATTQKRIIEFDKNTTRIG